MLPRICAVSAWAPPLTSDPVAASSPTSPETNANGPACTTGL